MSIASKLFGIWVVGKTASNVTPLFMRLLAGMAAVAFCAIVAAAIIVILIFGGVWLAYGQLVVHGMDGPAAALIVAGLLLALLGSMMLAAKSYISQLQIISKDIVKFQPSTGGGVSGIFTAFMTGLKSAQAFKYRRR